jgi:hypothetical protein
VRAFGVEAIDQYMQVLIQDCVILWCSPMHTIHPDLLLYSYYTKLLSASYPGVDFLFGSFDPCSSG